MANQKKKQPRNLLWQTGVGMAAAVAVVGVVLAMILLVIHLTGDASSPANPQPSYTDPQEQMTKPTEVLVLGDNQLREGLEILRVGEYAGMYMEDGSGDVVTDVMMIVLRNTSSQDLQLARIRIEYPDFTAEFELSCLPAGEAAVLLERNRRSLPADEAISVRSENVVFFPELMDLQTQRIQITGGNGYLELTNLTDQDITGDILVYYKNSTSDLLYGGITYRERIQGGLEAGETIRILASNYLPDSCTILMVTCGD